MTDTNKVTVLKFYNEKIQRQLLGDGCQGRIDPYFNMNRTASTKTKC